MFLEYDKPVIRNTAHLLNPRASMVDDEANQLWNNVMSAQCAHPSVSGQIWYVSHNGDDANDGKSPQTAVATIAALNEQCNPKAGDAILLECGGVYRGTLVLYSDMFLGSYGSGDKPCLYGSRMNYATAMWLRQENTTIWRLEEILPSDVGIVVFEHGESVGLKKTSLAELSDDLDFYFEDGYVYLYSDHDPSTRFHSIEIGVREHGVLMAAHSSNVTVDNLTVKYVGGHGIVSLDNAKNITIRNCEIGWIGGSYLSAGVPFGNGVEFWNGCENALVENCWVYQIFDSGLSHQGNLYGAKNITFRKNLIEYCDYASIEYWHHPGAGNAMEDVTYAENIMRFSGAGWGSFRRGSGAPHIRGGGGMDNLCTNFNITDNIIEGCGTGALLVCRSEVNTFPVFSGNRYIQSLGGSLAIYGRGSTDVRDAAYAQKEIKEIVKDTTGTFELYPY